MKIVDEFRQDEGRVLDRLVDGELSQAERRVLLAALDDEPGAWRRCALAFLEAQSWRWQLKQIASEPLVAQATALAQRDRGGAAWRRPRSSWLGAWLALAGSLLVAFGLGTRVSNNAPQVAATGAAQPPITAREAAPQPTREIQPSLAATATEAGSADNDESNPWETLTLAAVDDSGEADPDSQFSIRVRDAAADATELDALLAPGKSPLSAALLEQLREEGWEVTRRRELVPITLSDGRQVVLPMEQVDFQLTDVAHF